MDSVLETNTCRTLVLAVAASMAVVSVPPSSTLNPLRPSKSLR